MRNETDKSGELGIKREKYIEHQDIYKDVEMRIYDVAGGRSIRHMLQLQKYFKDKLKLKTARVDWRTKTGIILWFCDHWNLVKEILDNPVKGSTIASELENSKKTLTKRPYIRKHPYVKKGRKSSSDVSQSMEDYFSALNFEMIDEDFNSDSNEEEKNSSGEEFSQPEVEEQVQKPLTTVLETSLFDDNDENEEFFVVDEVNWTV